MRAMFVLGLDDLPRVSPGERDSCFVELPLNYVLIQVVHRDVVLFEIELLLEHLLVVLSPVLVLRVKLRQPVLHFLLEQLVQGLHSLVSVQGDSIENPVENRLAFAWDLLDVLINMLSILFRLDFVDHLFIYFLRRTGECAQYECVLHRRNLLNDRLVNMVFVHQAVRRLDLRRSPTEAILEQIPMVDLRLVALAVARHGGLRARPDDCTLGLLVLEYF